METNEKFTKEMLLAESLLCIDLVLDDERNVKWIWNNCWPMLLVFQCCARACVGWRRYVLFCMLSQAKKQQRQQHTLNHCKIMFKQKRTQQPSGHFLIYYFALRQQMHNLSMQKKTALLSFQLFRWMHQCILISIFNRNQFLFPLSLSQKEWKIA